MFKSSERSIIDFFLPGNTVSAVSVFIGYIGDTTVVSLDTLLAAEVLKLWEPVCRSQILSKARNPKFFRMWSTDYRPLSFHPPLRCPPLHGSREIFVILECFCMWFITYSVSKGSWDVTLARKIDLYIYVEQLPFCTSDQETKSKSTKKKKKGEKKRYIGRGKMGMIWCTKGSSK